MCKKQWEDFGNEINEGCETHGRKVWNMSKTEQGNKRRMEKTIRLVKMFHLHTTKVLEVCRDYYKKCLN